MISDENKNYWNGAWQNVENTISKRNVFYLIDTIKLEYILPLLKDNTREIKILEIGCGSARLSCFIASNGYNVMGLDFSKNALLVAKNNFKLINNIGDFILGDVKNLPFENNSYDVVISTGLLEHFRDPQIVVDEMVRVLKDGGLFFSDIVPKKFSLLKSLDFLVKLLFWIRWPEDNYYEKRLNKTDIEYILKTANLQNINVFAGGVVPPSILFSKRIPIREDFKGKILSQIKPISKWLDNTIIAELIGFHYICIGYKRDGK